MMIEIIITLLFSSFNLGVLGSIALWQRIINLGDSLSHAIIFSLVIEYCFGLPPTIGCVIVAIIFTVLARFLSTKSTQQNISMIVLSSMAIAITFLVSDLSNGDLNIRDFIVGDILSCSTDEMYIAVSLSFFILMFLYFKLNEIVLVSISEELAQVNSVKVKSLKLYISIILAITISVLIHIVGTLLMTAFLIIPPAAARIISSSPRQMLITSVLISTCSSMFALILSINYDISFSAVAIIVLSSLYLAVNIKKIILD